MLSDMSACSDKSAVMTSDRLALQNRNLGVIKEFGYLFERDQRWQGNPNRNVLDKKYHFLLCHVRIIARAAENYILAN